MFWECHIVNSSIDKLLDQPVESVTLQEFLDESDLIQECLTQNSRLIDYLTQPTIMNELISHMINHPANENFRNAFVVSELLSGDFQRIQEKLLEKEHLDLFYSFLLSNNDDEQTAATLNPILASYFSRTLTTLIIRRPVELLSYLKSRDTFKDDFLRHLDSTSITDVLYRLIADCADQRSEAVHWYEDMNFMDDLVHHLLTTESTSIQMNIVNLLSELLRLAFDQHGGFDNDMDGNTSTPLSSSRMDRLSYYRNETIEESSSSNPFAFDTEPENKSVNSQNAGKVTPLVLAQRILSRDNLEQLCSTLAKRPILVANGCDFLILVLDLLGRNMPLPIRLSLTAPFTDQLHSSDKNGNEQMQIDDDGGSPRENDINMNTADRTNVDALKKLTRYATDSLVHMYRTLLEAISSQLSPLIALLSHPSAPLVVSSTSSSSSPTHDSSQTVKYQFISEPLGPMRLNLIKFFCKLFYTISNDSTGDFIYQILDRDHLLHILIDLFHHHIYNNFLHAQVCLIVRLILHINSIDVKQPNDIWTRIPLAVDHHPVANAELSHASPLHHTNRASYRLFQSLLALSEVNLIERLLDQYELNVASSKSITTSSSSDDAITSALLHTRFVSPNSGHIAQILRCLREHAPTFDNYASFFKADDQPLLDENTSVIELRWQTALDHLGDEEKRWSAMHHNEQNNSNSFRINSSANTIVHMSDPMSFNGGSESNQRRHALHIRSFGSSGGPYMDDDDDDDEDNDEVERFNIDDGLMNHDRINSERRTHEMSSESQFPPVFDEQSIRYQQNNRNTAHASHDSNGNDGMKMASILPLPDLCENHQMHLEKSASTESSFEELCSLRANDHGSGTLGFPFQQSASIIGDETGDGQDEF